MRVLLIDNYDSFTYNLKQLLQQYADSVEVKRNDELCVKELHEYDAFVFSPGPSIPDNAGYMKDIIRKYAGKKPMLGVCLGMQAIAEVFKCELSLMSSPMHGIAKKVEHEGHLIFDGIPSGFLAARYHSWVVDSQSISEEINVIATADELVMALEHSTYPIYGLQFHPESILTEDGDQIISNFFNLGLVRNNTKQNETVTEEVI
jgi:anthranilate synthase component 2